MFREASQPMRPGREGQVHSRSQSYSLCSIPLTSFQYLRNEPNQKPKVRILTYADRSRSISLGRTGAQKGGEWVLSRKARESFAAHWTYRELIYPH